MKTVESTDTFDRATIAHFTLVDFHGWAQRADVKALGLIYDTHDTHNYLPAKLRHLQRSPLDWYMTLDAKTQARLAKTITQ